MARATLKALARSGGHSIVQITLFQILMNYYTIKSQWLHVL